MILRFQIPRQTQTPPDPTTDATTISHFLPPESPHSEVISNFPHRTNGALAPPSVMDIQYYIRSRCSARSRMEVFRVTSYQTLSDSFYDVCSWCSDTGNIWYWKYKKYGSSEHFQTIRQEKLSFIGDDRNVSEGHLGRAKDRVKFCEWLSPYFNSRKLNLILSAILTHFQP